MAMEILREDENENEEKIEESKEKWEKMARDILEEWNQFDAKNSMFKDSSAQVEGN